MSQIQALWRVKEATLDSWYQSQVGKSLEKLGKLAKIVSNTQRIDEIERHLGELDASEERVKDLIDAREGFDLVWLLDKFKELEGAIQPFIQQVNALEQARGALLAYLAHLVKMGMLMHSKPKWTKFKGWLVML